MTGGLLDHRRFRICRGLVRDLEVFRREIASLVPEQFVPYPDRQLHSGGWWLFPLVLQWTDPPPFLQLERNRELCPDSYARLAREPSIHAAAFSRLDAGCRITAHEDRPRRGVLRLHVPLRAAPGARICCDGRDHELREGTAFVLDPSLRHAAANEAPSPRDGLIVDFEPTPEEAAALQRDRGAVNLGPTADA